MLYLQIKAYLACTLPSMAMTMIRFSPSVFASSTDAIVVKQKSNSQTKKNYNYHCSIYRTPSCEKNVILILIIITRSDRSAKIFGNDPCVMQYVQFQCLLITSSFLVICLFLKRSRGRYKYKQNIKNPYNMHIQIYTDKRHC